MFERYTEQARRVLFFARYEVSRLGASVIDTEHLLLGLARQSEGLIARILALSRVSLETLRGEVEARCVAGERVSASVEIPFTPGAQRVLRFAAEEADRLRHTHIGTEHLLLGLLREEGSVAASVLTGLGLRLDDVRNTLVKLLAEEPDLLATSTSAEISEQIDHIKQLVEQLVDRPPDSGDAHALADRIRDSLEGLKRHLAR